MRTSQTDRQCRSELRTSAASALLAHLLVTFNCAKEKRGENLAGAVYPKAPVILISIDTLRSDHLPAWGYKGVDTPNIDRFRDDAILFEQAFSPLPADASLACHDAHRPSPRRERRAADRSAIPKITSRLRSCVRALRRPLAAVGSDTNIAPGFSREFTESKILP